MKKTLLLPTLALIAGLGTAASTQAAEHRPTVVELFTSQGCSSCPPADKLLTELAGRDDIVAIAYHVTYWDYIGWKDPLATDWGTDRQRRYAGMFERGHLYTPQMIINGKLEIVGSRRNEVANALVASVREAQERIPLALRRDADKLVITLPMRSLAEPLELWLVGYGGAHKTKISSGENRGTTLVNTNNARHMESLGSWTGEAKEIRARLPLPDNDGGIAVWIQKRNHGAIMGAAKMDF